MRRSKSTGEACNSNRLKSTSLAENSLAKVYSQTLKNTLSSCMNASLAKLNHEFCEQDFIDFPVWVTYYEPDDIDSLVEFGYDRQEVELLVAKIKNNDEYSFPLPYQAATAPFHYLYLSIEAITRGGNKLVGYVTGPCLGVFHCDKQYTFNTALRNWALQTASELSAALGERSVFPMQIKVIATGENREEDLY